MSGRYPEVKEGGNVVSFPASGAVEDKQLTLPDAKKQSKQYKPRGLKKDEQKVWDRVVPEIILAGRFKPFFVEFFKNYAVVVARMETFLEFLNDEANGWNYTTCGRNGEQHKTRPEAAQYNDDWRKWNSMINQMGMSPATDQRFHSLQPDLFGNDPYATM